MAIINVSDILVFKEGRWLSMRDKQVYSSRWRTFQAGSGVAKDGNWYVLKEIYERAYVSANVIVTPQGHQDFIQVYLSISQSIPCHLQAVVEIKKRHAIHKVTLSIPEGATEGAVEAFYTYDIADTWEAEIASLEPRQCGNILIS